MKSFKFLSLTLVVGSLNFLTGCGNEDPVKEDIPELITKATVTFTPSTGAPIIIITATDPDGKGPQSIATNGPINLTRNISYTLSIQLINELAKSTDPEYDITAQVQEEGYEHQFYFSWTDGVFSDPAGNGNIDNRADKINYKDKDKNNLPIGISTDWKAGTTTSTGTPFRIVLKHQPDLKSATSTFNDGETDLDVTFTINVN